jgi:hypothetical protein
VAWLQRVVAKRRIRISGRRAAAADYWHNLIELDGSKQISWTWNGLCVSYRVCSDIERGRLGGREMTEYEFQTKLGELMGEISHLPPSERQKLTMLAEETRERHERLRQTVSSLQESLDYLRLSIKYLVFDLEATKRENGYLRKMLEETADGSDM